MKTRTAVKSGSSAKPFTSRQKALLAIEAAAGAKAGDPVAFRVGKLVDYTDYFVILSGESTVQVRAIFERILAAVNATRSPLLGCEGETEGRWVVIDWGDVVIHIFHSELRSFYELEKLWADAPRLRLPKAAVAAGKL